MHRGLALTLVAALLLRAQSKQVEKATTKSDDKIRHTGKTSARIDTPSGHAAPPRCPIRTDLRLTPGTKYLLRVYIRLENYTIDGKKGEVKVHARFATDRSPRNFESNAVRGEGKRLRPHGLDRRRLSPRANCGKVIPRFAWL